MKRLLSAYKQLLCILFTYAPAMVILTIFVAITIGLLAPLKIFINQRVFDGGISVATGQMPFNQLLLYLVLFVVIIVLPGVLSGFVYDYAQYKSILIINTVYKSKLLQKFKTIRYEHFESESSMEIIDKAYNRTEGAVRHMWPMFVVMFISSTLSSIGVLYVFFTVRWWLPFTIIIPYIIHTFLNSKFHNNIYALLETFWGKERQYTILGDYLRSREYVKELRIFGSANWLINLHSRRLNQRNKEYESFFFKNMRWRFINEIFKNFASLINLIILLFLFLNTGITIGAFLALSTAALTVYGFLEGMTGLFRSHNQVNFFTFYDKFFSLSDELGGTQTSFPSTFDIEFKDVWFRYPGSDKDVLKGLTFHIKNGESVSLVGENGEGKSTIVKLLLGLFTPDSGNICIGGKNLNDFSPEIRTKIFAPVFQDFMRYNISVRDNIGVGDAELMKNDADIFLAARKAKVDEYIHELAEKYDTLLGKEFDGGVDLSGGQWQRIALARAFMGDKPVMLLDEPTSQLDPMAEAKLYGEFAEINKGKTSLFITHRLGATKITDRILLVSNGVVTEDGTHEQLIAQQGVYCQMFKTQKEWYL